MKLAELNSLPETDAIAEFFKCCSSKAWARTMALKRPFLNMEQMKKHSDEIWFELTDTDWLEAFSHHPQIGGNMKALKEKFQATRDWSNQEQKGVAGASEVILKELSELNLKYSEKFGFVFLICATGKSAKEMLQALKARMNNTIEQELHNASIEQSKIAHIRLEKLIS